MLTPLDGVVVNLNTAFLNLRSNIKTLTQAIQETGVDVSADNDIIKNDIFTSLFHHRTDLVFSLIHSNMPAVFYKRFSNLLVFEEVLNNSITTDVGIIKQFLHLLEERTIRACDVSKTESWMQFHMPDRLRHTMGDKVEFPLSNDVLETIAKKKKENASEKELNNIISIATYANARKAFLDCLGIIGEIFDHEVTMVFNKILPMMKINQGADEYNCYSIEGMLTHEFDFVIRPVGDIRIREWNEGYSSPDAPIENKLIAILRDEREKLPKKTIALLEEALKSLEAK